MKFKLKTNQTLTRKMHKSNLLLSYHKLISNFSFQ